MALVKRISTERPALLWIHADRVIWWSDGFIGARTSRPTVALLLGLRRELEVHTAGMGTLRCRAVLVGPNVARSLVAEQAGFYSLSLDPAHKACRWLRDRVLAGRELLDLSDALPTAPLDESQPEPAQDCRTAHAVSEHLLRHFFPGIDAAEVPDPRVQQAAAWLREHLPARVDMRRLGAACGLSAGRLTHLYSQELGVSLRSHLLWIKMCRAIELLAEKRSVTEVAATIGFSDAAHFSRALRTFYSAAPSFIANRELVKVQSCTP